MSVSSRKLTRAGRFVDETGLRGADVADRGCAASHRSTAAWTFRGCPHDRRRVTALSSSHSRGDAALYQSLIPIPASDALPAAGPSVPACGSFSARRGIPRRGHGWRCRTTRAGICSARWEGRGTPRPTSRHATPQTAHSTRPSVGWTVSVGSGAAVSCGYRDPLPWFRRGGPRPSRASGAIPCPGPVDSTLYLPVVGALQG